MLHLKGISVCVKMALLALSKDLLIFNFHSYVHCLLYCLQSATFARTAGKIKKKYWWRNLKMKIIIGIVVTVVLLIIVIGICYGTGVFSGSSDDKKTTVAPSILTTLTISTPPSG